MATSTAILSITPDSVPYNTWSDGKKQHVIGTIAISAGNYAVGGLALSFADEAIKSTKIRWVDIKGFNAPGFRYRYVAATGKLMIWEMDDDTEQEDGTAIDATVVADIIDVYAIFDQMR